MTRDVVQVGILFEAPGVRCLFVQSVTEKSFECQHSRVPEQMFFYVVTDL
jgi:hypothetical protein